MGYRRSRSQSTKVLVILSIVVIGVAIAAAFAGVQPLAAYKDTIIKSVISYTQTSPASIPFVQIATTENIYAAGAWFNLCVELKPTTQAKANYQYKVNLFEKGKLRDTSSVIWNQPELNVKTIKRVYFPLTREEFYAFILIS